jgi:uncharacterized protein YkwD
MGRVLLALILLLSQASGPAHGQAGGPFPRATRDLRQMAREIFLAINEQRHAYGLQELEWDEKLAEQARSHSSRMAARDEMSHVDPERGNLAARLKRAHITWQACAENLFEERGLDDPVQAAVEGWMKSEGHRQNILRPELQRTGVGIAARSNGALYFTQIFIKP